MRIHCKTNGFIEEAAEEKAGAEAKDAAAVAATALAARHLQLERFRDFVLNFLRCRCLLAAEEAAAGGRIAVGDDPALEQRARSTS